MSQLVILLHSSKSMRRAPFSREPRPPTFLSEATELASYVRSLSLRQLQVSMHISPSLAERTHQLYREWSEQPELQSPAIDSFIGDIYSGLQVSSLTAAQRLYADQTIWILSGLYGLLRPLDGISPYRLEMGYKLPAAPYTNLSRYWGERLAAQLPLDYLLINISSKEYDQVIMPYIDSTRVITPRFLTISPKTGQPTFTAVHAKIARGAFARWLITTHITHPAEFFAFSELGYHYDPSRSTLAAPVFICEQFDGKGLSVRTKL